MLNGVQLMGRLTADPELRYTQNKKAVASFRLAVKRDVREGTDFINCTAWGKAAEFVSKYFTKGRMAAVSGRLQSRNWEDKDGKNRTSYEVVADNVYFADSEKKGESTPRDPFVEEYGEPDELPF